MIDADYLLRILMWQTGTTYGVPPLRSSLQRTRHYLDNFIPKLLANLGTQRNKIYRTLVKMIVHKQVSDLLKAAALSAKQTLRERYRPSRSKLRVRKRRSKAISW